MTKLPTIPLETVQGAAMAPGPSFTPQIQATDFGLGHAGQALAEAQQYMMQADRSEAGQRLESVKTDNQVNFEQDAAALTPDTAPGFAQGQIAKTRARLAEAMADPDLSSGVRLQMGMLANQEVARVGDQAIAHEAKVRAGPILALNDATREARVLNAYVPAQMAFEADRQTLIDNYDGSQPGLANDVAAAYDQAQQAAMKDVPPDLQGEVMARFSAGRVQAVASAAATEKQHQSAFVFNSLHAQADAATNTVLNNPAAYDNVTANVLPQLVAALPAGIPKAMRRDSLQGLMADAAGARVHGLINQGQPQLAMDELTGGRFDEALKPSKKEELISATAAAIRNTGPKTFDQYLAGDALQQQMQAELYARTTRGESTGGVDLDHVVTLLGPAKAAEYQTQLSLADRTFAAAGAVRDMSLPQLQGLAGAEPPDPKAPDYAEQLQTWQVQQQAAAAEIKGRQQPGAWAFSTGPTATKGKGVAGAGVAQDRGEALQQAWQAFLANPSYQTGAQIAGQSIGVQYKAGVPAQAYQLVPQAEAARLAAGVTNAAPEQKLAAMQSLGHVIASLPPSSWLPNGQAFSPQAILTRQLQAAHMTPAELSAVVDYGGDQAKLGRYIAALNDPTLKQPLPAGQSSALRTAVLAQLKPALDSARPLPGAEALEQGRLDRTTLIARNLMHAQGLTPQAAAQAAAQDMTAGYQFIGGMRIKQGAIEPSAARAGAGQLLAQLTADNGANLYAPATLPGSPDDRRRLYAAKIGMSARWVTSQDDAGVQLMAPNDDGTWATVADRYGRPVSANWAQLKAQAQNSGPLRDGFGQNPAPNPFATPPPGAVRAPDGAALPAVSPGAAFSALSWAVGGQESGHVGGQVSAKGALGLMQVMPETAAPYALKLTGKPLDAARLQNDADYNKAIGNAVLNDQIRHFGSGAGIGLALAAYNAGPGRLEGYRDTKTGQWVPGWLQTIGDPRTGRISLTDFVSRIPYPETRQYVQAVLPSALKRLQANH